MKCDKDFFHDKNTLECLPCADSCDPNRAETEVECRLHCSGYLQRIQNTQTSVEQNLHDSLPSTNSGLTNVLIIVSTVSVFVLLTVVFAIVLLLIFRRRQSRKVLENKNYLEAVHLIVGVQPSLEEPQKKERSSSACPDIEFSSLDVKNTVLVSTHEPSRDEDKFIASCQESHLQHNFTRTPLKTVEINDVPSSVAKQTRAVSALDLQEDGYDFVEQPFGAFPGEYESVNAVGNHNSSNVDRQNARITALLQRLPWIRQFWWDSEGAKIAVDDSHRENGREKIEEILQQEGIPRLNFDFEVVRISDVLRTIW